jgi:hypothetical protein
MLKLGLTMIFATLAFATVASAGIIFENPTAQQPLMMRLVGYNSFTDHALDKGGVQRLALYPEIPAYAYISQSGVELEPVATTVSEYRQLKNFVSTATLACPVDIEVNRESGAIVRLHAACDPLK